MMGFVSESPTTDQGENMVVVSKPVSALKPAQKKAFYANVHAAADAAGREAAQAAVLPQYVAVQHANPLDDSSEVVKVWEQPFELCGFASVQIKGANKGYGKWVVASGVGKTDSYNGGAYIWVSSFGQSHGRKVAYAGAYADSAEAALAEAGEEATVWVSERLD
tara:strand:- start:342 stop:833 length:492 start_codon:yes stop_codon:yes gene_type:complete